MGLMGKPFQITYSFLCHFDYLEYSTLNATYITSIQIIQVEHCNEYTGWTDGMDPMDEQIELFTGDLSWTDGQN